jgi:heme exporter protein C
MTDKRLVLYGKWLLGVAFVALILAAFYYAPAARGFKGQSSRIVFFHVPTAWVAVLAFCVNLVASIRYLRNREALDDARAAAAARLGLVFSVLATVTGSIFAHVMWESFWNWDPREISIAILLLIYAAYFALRQAIPDEERMASLSAAYALLAFITMPFLIFVVPRVYWSLHPDTIINTRGSMEMQSRMFQVLMAGLVGFTALFFWLYTLDVRMAKIRLARRQREEV